MNHHLSLLLTSRRFFKEGKRVVVSEDEGRDEAGMSFFDMAPVTANDIHDSEANE